MGMGMNGGSIVVSSSGYGAATTTSVTVGSNGGFLGSDDYAHYPQHHQQQMDHQYGGYDPYGVTNPQAHYQQQHVLRGGWYSNINSWFLTVFSRIN
jgi:hypothetical protein